MIFDELKNCALYYGVNKHFEKAFDFIKSYASNPLEAGTYEIDGKDVFAMVQDNPLKDDARFETHKLYIDIQFVISGSEKMQYAPVDSLTLTEDKTPDKDVLFYDNTNLATDLKVYAQSFAVFFPNDGHKPGLKLDGETNKKIVVKVRA